MPVLETTDRSEEKEHLAAADNTGPPPEDHKSENTSPDPPALQQGKPILPSAVAKTVSFGTGTARGALRAAKFVGGFPFNAAKFTALTSIELGRHTFESVLGLAGRDVYSQAQTDLGRAQTQSVVARAFDVAHRGFTYLQLFTAQDSTSPGAAYLLSPTRLNSALPCSTVSLDRPSRHELSAVSALS